VVKQPGHEPHHLPPSSAEVKNAWSHTSTPPYAFMAWCLLSMGVIVPYVTSSENIDLLNIYNFSTYYSTIYK
jgi:hypothetical protein